jgi:hypothetical protein
MEDAIDSHGSLGLRGSACSGIDRGIERGIERRSLTLISSPVNTPLPIEK